MADINQVISLGIGSPAAIKQFLTFGLGIGAGVNPIGPLHMAIGGLYLGGLQVGGLMRQGSQCGGNFVGGLQAGGKMEQ